MIRWFTYLLLSSIALLAIEGQDPTPRFVPPDFTVEEDRITSPGDLIEFFSRPFEEYLNMSSKIPVIQPFAMANSEQEAVGGLDFHYNNLFAQFRGSQRYFGENIPRKMLRSADFRAGYADFVLDRIPYGIFFEGDYGYFRGAYEPSQYSFRASGEGHVPVRQVLISPYAHGLRESWNQRPGPLARRETYDMHRQHITNAFGGGLRIRGTLSEFTGFEVRGEGARTERYREGQWIRKYQILTGLGMMVFDSKPMRIEVGGRGDKTWEETIIAPHLNFHLTGDYFYVKANLSSDAKLPLRSETNLSPRVDFPINADYIITPTLINVEGRLELKPNQYLLGILDYRSTRGDPVLLLPLAEAPQIQCLDVSRQSFTLRLLNDFGTFSNSLNMTLKSDEHEGEQLPLEPLQIIADTFSVMLDTSFAISIQGTRIDLPQVAPKVINDIGISASYFYDRYEFRLGISNLLANDVWNNEALELTNEIRFWGGITVDF